LLSKILKVSNHYGTTSSAGHRVSHPLRCRNSICPANPEFALSRLMCPFFTRLYVGRRPGSVPAELVSPGPRPNRPRRLHSPPLRRGPFHSIDSSCQPVGDDHRAPGEAIGARRSSHAAQYD
jgi:hypothetical protein